MSEGMIQLSDGRRQLSDGLLQKEKDRHQDLGGRFCVLSEDLHVTKNFSQELTKNQQIFRMQKNQNCEHLRYIEKRRKMQGHLQDLEYLHRIYLEYLLK